MRRLRCAIFSGPAPGKSARAARTLNFRNEGGMSLRRCAANPGRASPRPERRQPVSGGRSDDRRGPSRSPTGPTSDRPGVPPAGNRATLPPPSRGRATGAAGSASPQALSTRLPLQGGTAVPARGCPRGRREEPAVMLVDADGSPARQHSLRPAQPKAAAGQRHLRAPHAPRSASKPAPLSAGFRTGASPLR